LSGEYLVDMSLAQPGQPIPRKPLRLWPGVVIVVLMGLARFVVPVVWPDTLEYSVLSGMAGTLAVVVWWAFFSRAPGFERWGAVSLMIVAMFAARPILDKSIATGAMGMLFLILAVPVLGVAFVVWAVATSQLSDRVRRVTMVATILLASGGWALIRTNGFTAEAASDLAWRWAPTAEDRLLALEKDKPTAVPTTAAAKISSEPATRTGDDPATATPTSAAAKIPAERLARAATNPIGHEPAPPAAIAGAMSGANTGADWPGFRGPRRDGSVPGVQIETDWSRTPPVQMWRRPIGPGWSSFAVRGDVLYTQEQRGSDEVVACYKVSTGEPVWRHADAARFWESNGGPGPRATPTLSNGRVYTFGATGIVNALDARNGAVVWSRNAASDTGKKIPEWGFASSPLVVDDMVIVGVSGKLVAYDIAAGQPRWLGPDGGVSYSSPVLSTIDGVAQILLLSTTGAASVALADGKPLWNHPWSGYPIVQPALVPDGDILISVSDTSGTRRLAVAHGPAGWTAEERWTSAGLKPYFNDFVIHNGHAFGFDGGILACIDLKDGKRTWKGGRYGHGQLVLLPDQALLLVLSEEGELALVAAASDQFKELARFPAVEGKTWNHPVLVGDVLLVRNGQEMAAFRLSRARP
jgi:outer membrane protein assembly factor BamB